MAARDQFRSLSSLSRAIVILLWVDLTASAAYVLASLGFLSHLRGRIAEEGPDALISDSVDLAASEVAQILISLLLMVLSVALIIMICRWIFRAAWNVRHLGAKRLDISPGMAVGWYFVPFANLVFPFRAMREIWLASHDPMGWRETSVSLISGWWGLWLVSGIVNHIGLRATLSAETVQQLHTTELLSIAGYTLSAGTSLLFIRVVQGVQRAQDRAQVPAPPSPNADADASLVSVEA